jgi:hypothetical protein
MIRFEYPLKIQLYRSDGETSVLTHVVSLTESELTPCINGVHVAYARQRGDGLSQLEQLNAIVVPVKQCACAPNSIEDIERMKRLGCIVLEFDVRLQRGSIILFEQRLPLRRLAPLAWAKYHQLGLSSGQNEGEKQKILWQLAADFLTRLPECDSETEDDSEDDEDIELEEAEPLRFSILNACPQGRSVGDVAENAMPIYIRQGALDALLRHAQDAPEDAGNSRAEDFREIGGALLGQVGRSESGRAFVLVEDVPLLTTQGSHATVTFGWQAFQQVRERLRAQTQHTLLGLWHVHPPSFDKAFASQQDLWGFQTFFPQPWNIFAVVGRTLEQTAFFEWTNDGQVESVGFTVTDTSHAE